MAKKNHDVFTQMTPVFVVREYVYQAVRVLVSINFKKKVINLLEDDATKTQNLMEAKRWVFKNRGLEYMAGWRQILEAMEYAISQAELELQDFIKMEDERNSF